ncbi:hypothetical protein PHYBLDRAFT_158287 [Phycomyces blakesleeanus NRRL 1555(-)]|uniref:Uncharacterized protein n=1 Tax=Phycomyces blakesleeanus (strain ATCC 8743b / DSM 1359 / FGSC 10004 / NBRC 33097 / NRRL 1555) TaxID=763407 RepID=A0A167NNG3_PHYB8|nr:hypothetical protein PHYBLDRAFT_158287 [Phycomyces blakesleeanus NRRL 1555(-)]OAD76340.1 hypothetical protein PHYBLDRAFT_158287 [Phycomyces blakesleeanus NRRL 1555(-)]|eukprot:XP_018294380.1 hypothetical protein PHYBLDRAFT_158287 [Phycomyces blakesleeanus NRRL 1555(-)]
MNITICSGARISDMNNVDEMQIRKFGCWKNAIMYGAYLTSLSRKEDIPSRFWFDASLPPYSSTLEVRHFR